MSKESNREAPLDAYLDNLLPEVQRQAFEARLKGDPEMHEGVRSQRRIDESLGRLFEPPSGSGIVRRVTGPGVSTPAGAQQKGDRLRRWLRPGIAVAAVVGLTVVGAWVLPPLFRPTPPLVAEYAARVASGWIHDWECPQKQFAVTTRRRFGQGAVLASIPAGVTPLGICYTNCISARTIYLIANVDGAEVAVFIDRIDKDPGQPGTGRDDLRQFRRELGPLVLYELTPLDGPRIIGAFEPMDVPAAWLNEMGYGPSDPLAESR